MSNKIIRERDPSKPPPKDEGRVIGNRQGRGYGGRRFDSAGALWYMISNGGTMRDPAGGGGYVTGSANGYIHRPPDIFEHFLRIVFNGPTTDYTSSGFGSFDQASTDIDAYTDAITAGADWACFYPILEPKNIYQVMFELSSQAPIVFFRSMYDSLFKAVVYDQSPASDNYFKDPYGNNYQWSYVEDMIKDSIRVSYTPLDECFNEVRINFDLYQPTGNFKRTAFVGPDTSDNGNGTRDANAAGDREDQADAVKGDFYVVNTLELDCDQIIQMEQAKALRNIMFDRYHRPRMVLEFDTWARACGIEPHMATLVSNDLTDYLPLPKYPDYTSALNWDDVIWFVNDVSMRHTPQGDIWHLVLEEVPQTSGDST